MNDYNDILDTVSGDVSVTAAMAQIRKIPPNERGRPPNEARVQALVQLIRQHPGHRAGWYAHRLGIDNKAGIRLLVAAERLGYRLAESHQGCLYLTENLPDDDDLAWLDQRQRPDADGVRRLLFAVLAQAAVEAQDGNPEVLEWFRGPIARHYCSALDIDHADMVRKLDEHRARRVVRKPTGLGRSATDEYKRTIYDRYDEWRRLGEPLDHYAERIGVNYSTLRSQFSKFGLSVAYTRPRGNSD